MKDRDEFQITGIPQVKLQMKWVWIVCAATVVFVLITGPMLWAAATSRPATVNTGGYTNGEDW